MTVATDAPTADTGPGFLAFVAFFVLALALWFLMRNMNARMRRMSYRQQAAGRGKDDPQADGSVGGGSVGGVAGRGPDRTGDPGDGGGSGSDGGGPSHGGGASDGGGGGGE